MNESLYAHIKTLPPLPESIAKIQAICSDPNSSIADLARIVETDPMLTANLLKAANSPLYGFSREIKTLAQAVSLFGMATVRGFALAGAVRSTLQFDLTPYGIDLETFAKLSQEQNALIVRWYSQVSRAMLEVLSPAAFLTGIGRVIMSQEIIRSGRQQEFIKLTGEQGLVEAEKQFFGVSYQEVSAAVFRHWRFEQELVDAIDYSRDPLSAPASFKAYACALSVVQSAVSIPDGITDESAKIAGRQAISYGLSGDLFDKAIVAFLK
ncbi:MAG: HDOD domain-containing protein [Helicobacteraceae bacterium]|jgi:HD-like signal output (HDOD) protein|nr:HDOD domain-containing protein [Helicobacteraceae bacterium]